MKEFWNQRYASPAYTYGTEPNAFFKHKLDQLRPGKLLLPAEGEGRNAVYAASRGWEVTACDYSEQGKNIAELMAASRHVKIAYHVAELGGMAFIPAYFDCVGLVFAHFTPDLRPLYHQKILHALKPGGAIILEGFSEKQLGKSSGGPKSLDMLFSEKELLSDFGELSMLEISEEAIVLAEGAFHQGPASVIRLFGQK
jgi:SAM-dependent methyltransferase